jgi:hypothetical protein
MVSRARLRRRPCLWVALRFSAAINGRSNPLPLTLDTTGRVEPQPLQGRHSLAPDVSPGCEWDKLTSPVGDGTSSLALSLAPEEHGNPSTPQRNFLTAASHTPP